ncbi:hypothetical protein ACLMJK_004332 [Lecanora helva]
MTSLYDQDRGGEILGAAISLMIISIITVALRFIARWRSGAQLWWDDWTILIALVKRSAWVLGTSLTVKQTLDTGLNICYIIYVVDTWAGRHTSLVGGPVDPEKLMNQNKVLVGILVFYFCNSVAFKTSSLLLYYRIFNVVAWFRRTLLGAGFIVVSYGIICLLLTFLECRPLKFYWDKSVPGGTCLDQAAFYKWNGFANLLVDLMILFLTFPIVWRLKIELKQKIQITAVFLVGFFVLAAAIARVATFDQLKLKDESYTVVTPTVWSIVEQGLGVTCACLPTLGHLFHRRISGDRKTKPSSRHSAIDGKRAVSMGDTVALAPMPNTYLTTVSSQIPSRSASYLGVKDGGIMKTHSLEQYSKILDIA